MQVSVATSLHRTAGICARVPSCITMIWRTFLHVGWLWLVLSVASAQLTAEQKTEILRLHNQYRSSVNPGASNMKRMLWDNTLSQVAVRYATTCRWEHNPLIKGILGENLFMALGPLIIRQPLELWYNEFNNYDFSNKNCASGKQCGHYTQMVWANTSFIGCASYFCSNVSNFDAQNATILVCNYFPAGNIIGESPYKAGPSCFSCPNGTIRCTEKYCDQGSNITIASTGADINAMIASAQNNMINIGTNAGVGSSAGFTTPSAAPLLLTALTALYIRMT